MVTRRSNCHEGGPLGRSEPIHRCGTSTGSALGCVPGRGYDVGVGVERTASCDTELTDRVDVLLVVDDTQKLPVHDRGLDLVHLELTGAQRIRHGDDAVPPLRMTRRDTMEQAEGVGNEVQHHALDSGMAEAAPNPQ